MKHNSIKTTQNKKRIENKKKATNQVFKSSLFILSAFSLFFSLMIIFVIFGKGVNGFANGMLDLPSFLFGDKYDGVALFAAGFMVINTL
jgi:ABC-type phosphate transport system permease subunit